MTRVFDATPLIYLAKANRLGIIEAIDEPRLVPEAVYQEVVTSGVDAGYDGARRIERVVEDGTLEVISVAVEDSPLATRLARHPGLSDADVAVLTCAGAHNATAIMDEATGRSAADVEGIETRGTAFLVLSAVKRGAMSPEAGRETIDAMIDPGWYVAPDLYTKLVQKLESFE